jgi:hypothetical protein
MITNLKLVGPQALAAARAPARHQHELLQHVLVLDLNHQREGIFMVA